jgi:hypothetical protein
VRNVRIDTSLISQFSQAKAQVTTEPDGVANLLGALFYPASTMMHLVSLSQEAGAAASMGSSRFRRCLQSACVLASRTPGDRNGVGGASEVEAEREARTASGGL